MPKVNNSKKVTSPKADKVLPEELQATITALNKKFGNNAVTVGVPADHVEIQRIPTGSLTLDIALGGGIPVGRFIEIAGNESSTKTTQTCHIIRNAQKLGYIVAFADVENTSDERYFKQLGVDTSNLIYMRPDSTEEATESLLQLQKSGATLLVLDSIASMVPNKESESKMDETVRMGIPQQLLGEFLRKFQANNNRLEREGKTPATLICLNQLRQKIGGYGDPEYAPGGMAKKFMASVFMLLRRGDWISEGTAERKKIVGQVVKFKIEKNKTYKRMQTGEFDFYFADNKAGVRRLYNDNISEVIALAVEWDVIQRKGAWFYYKDQKYQGLEKAVEDLSSRPEVMEEIKQQVLELATAVSWDGEE